MKRTCIVLGFLALVFLPFAVFAQDSSIPSTNQFVPLTNIPSLTEAGRSNTLDLTEFLNSIYKISIGVAAVIAVLQIMRAGIMYMGGDSITEKKEAKNLIALSIGGLVLVLSPVIVFSIINPNILSLKIGNIDKLATKDVQDVFTGGAVTVPQNCEAFKAPKGETKAIVGVCDATQGYQTIGSQCCGTLAAGSQCCGRSTTPGQTAPAAARDFWDRITSAVKADVDAFYAACDARQPSAAAKKYVKDYDSEEYARTQDAKGNYQYFDGCEAISQDFHTFKRGSQDKTARLIPGTDTDVAKGFENGCKADGGSTTNYNNPMNYTCTADQVSKIEKAGFVVADKTTLMCGTAFYYCENPADHSANPFGS